MRLPGRGSLPGIDEHLVEPEVTRDEIIGGRRYVASPAKEPHATQQCDLDYVIRAHVAPGWKSAADLLTRHDQDSDFATDTCVLREGIDPETGGRYLEELAFEVVAEQTEARVGEKAVRMHRRGVRRTFALFLKERRVCEWSAQQGDWIALAADSRIEDPCLAVPLSVAALLDAAGADNAVAEALIAKGNPAIRRHDAERDVERLAESILSVLGARGVAVSERQTQEILSCQDLVRLEAMLRRAAVSSSAEEVTAGI
jgi:hypothetical protein